MTMPRFDDDDDDEFGSWADAQIQNVRAARSCDALLADLLRAERLPVNVDPEHDRHPRLYPAPGRSSMGTSPGQRCVDAAPPEDGAGWGR
jgi:hypothetical protein